MSSETYHGCAIPPETHEIGFGWDPTAEVERLLFLAREAGATPATALELGCGGGRLLKPLRERGLLVMGLELSAAMAAAARAHSGADVHIGDMSCFQFDQPFDLIYSSANSLRHVTEPESIARMWRSVASGLAPDGVFIADLELGVAYEAGRLGKPACWTIFREARSVRVMWEVVAAPRPERPRSTIEWRFEQREGDDVSTWSERFELRAYEATEFVSLAEQSALLELAGLYEPRDPHLLERPPEKMTGRALVVLRRRRPAPT